MILQKLNVKALENEKRVLADTRSTHVYSIQIHYTYISGELHPTLRYHLWVKE